MENPTHKYLTIAINSNGTYNCTNDEVVANGGKIFNASTVNGKKVSAIVEAKNWAKKNNFTHLKVIGKKGTPKVYTLKKDKEDVYRQFFIDDTGGNKMRIQQNDKLIIITLLLKGDKPRRIGRVTKSTRTIEMKRVMSQHLFIKGNAYGFCDHILREATSFDWIRLTDDQGNHWKVPRTFIVEHGSFLNFAKQGFELQRFVSLEQLEQFKVKPEENRRF